MYDEKQLYKEGKSVKDHHLDAFLSASGLKRLQEFIDENLCKDATEVEEIIKRLFEPGYEQERSR